jgi:hypothetical protein
MRISWKRVGIVAALIVVTVAAQPTVANRKPKDVFRCPSSCEANQVCGQSNEVPKQCGPSKNGPWSASTYSCCCCTENSAGNWFYGG